MSDFVSAAPPSGGIQWAELKGKLLVIEPLSVETGIQTTFGVADAVRANVYVLNGPGDTEEHSDVLVFPRVLQNQLKGQISKKVVGRLGSGVAKPGQSAPHLLEEANAEDLQKAQAWVESRQTSNVTSAAAPF